MRTPQAAADTLTPAATFQHSPDRTGSISAVHLAFSVSKFDPGLVNADRPGPNADRMLVAQLTGEARHHARWRPLTEEEEAVAMTELRALAGGRTDLLAQVAGLFEGTSNGELDEPFAKCAADLCRKAGADLEAIPQWVAEGKRRAEAARKPPFSEQARRTPPRP